MIDSLRALKLKLAKNIDLTSLKFLLPPNIIFYGHVITQSSAHPAWKLYRYPTSNELFEFITKLRKLGYDFVPLSEYTNISTKNKTCLLTFDDGFQSIRTDLHPLLKSLDIPYALFIHPPSRRPHAFPLDDVKFDSCVEFLSLDDILFLKSEGVHVGFHGNSHQRLEHISEVGEIKFHAAPDPQTLNLLSSPKSYAYPYQAPKSYADLDEIIFQFGFDYIFDTQGFGKNKKHFFRVPLDISHAFSDVKNCCEFSLILHTLSFVSRHSYAQ